MLPYSSSSGTVAERLSRVRERLEVACQRIGRRAKEVEVVFVTKEVGVTEIQAAYELGLRDFGENRVQEWGVKRDLLPQDVRWHFIGHLQTNKVKFLMGRVALIHSCDRLDLARELERQAAKSHAHATFLIQVNTAGEATKYGFDPDEVERAVPQILSFKHLAVKGLMTVGPFTEDQGQIRKSFQMLRSLRDRLRHSFPDQDWHYLSMGMSSDFEIAVEEGANLLRIGTALFGLRS